MAIDVIRLRDEGLGNSAYLVDLGDGGALLVDPPRVIAPCLDEAERRGLRVRFVAETHLHADFVSGSREWGAQGAGLLLPADAHHVHEHRGLRDHDVVELGDLSLQVIATPGHTPEHLALLLRDGDQPLALFTGGTLIAGGVARPDLVGPEQTEPLARAAWRSITQRLWTLPDDLAVYPTHGGGSFCSAGTAGRGVTTIGDERRDNPLLQAGDEDEFVDRLLGGLGSFPPYFLQLREVNRRGPVVHGRTLPSLDRLTPAQLAGAMDGGAVVVDARPIDRFAAGHVPGSVSIELRDQFGTWLGWVVEFGTAVAVVIDDDQPEHELIGQALTVGYDRLVGRLDGGVAAWATDGRRVDGIPLLVPGHDLADRPILDVRQQSEWLAGHVPGALHHELGSLAVDPPSLPAGLVAHCGHGQRAMTAASLLRRAGHQDVAATPVGHAELADEPAR